MKSIFKIICLLLFVQVTCSGSAEAEARIIKTSPGHCEIWDLLIPTWPTRKVGKEKQTNTKRAEAETVKKMTCRIKKRVANPETGGTQCIFQRAGYERDDVSLSIEKGEACPVTFACPAD